MSDIHIDEELTYTDPITMKSWDAALVGMVDELLYKVRKKSIWEITDFCIRIWAKKYPKQHKQYLKAVKDIRTSRKNKTGSTEEKQLRYLVEPPSDVSYLLEKLAKHKLEEYGRTKYWREFARRYPGFSVAEKV